MSSSKVFRVFPNSGSLLQADFASGSYIHSKGKKYLDLTAGGTSFAILGWSDELVNESIRAQLHRYAHIDYKIWDDPNLEVLASLILGNNLKTLNKVYFSGNSGAEACEAAMKISFQVNKQLGFKNKKWFISRKQSYHGSTADALVLGDRPNLEFYKEMLSPFRKQIPMHHFKKLAHPEETGQEYAIRSANELETMILQLGPENVSGFVAETMMGGLIGDVPPVEGYWRRVREICDEYKVHLILDEVYCGTGTSGRYFCFEYDFIEPDMVFIGKTLAAGYGAISAVITSDQIHDSIRKSLDSRLQHTTTHQGHSLAVAAAIAVQSRIREGAFVEEVYEKGIHFRKLLENRLNKFTNIVDIRGRGLRFSIEHNINPRDQVDFGSAFESIMKDEYGMLTNAKWHRVCFTPALIVSYEEIEQSVNAIEKTFDYLFSKMQFSFEPN